MEFGVPGDCGEWTFQGAILEACIWSARTESPVSLSVCTSDAHVTGSPLPCSHSCKIFRAIFSGFRRQYSSMLST